MKLEVGKYYRTYGGWKALIIWEMWNQGYLQEYIRYFVIHRPGEEKESVAIIHGKDGKAKSLVDINAPPLYNEHHPADLKEEWPKS